MREERTCGNRQPVAGQGGASCGISSGDRDSKGLILRPAIIACVFPLKLVVSGARRDKRSGVSGSGPALIFGPDICHRTNS